MRRLLVVPLLALAVVLAGCTGASSSAEDFTGAEADVADTVERLQSAGERNDAGELCTDVLSVALRDQVARGGVSCADELDKALGEADDFDLDVADVTVTGDRATARVEGRLGGREDQRRTLGLTRVGGGWRISSLDAG